MNVITMMREEKKVENGKEINVKNSRERSKKINNKGTVNKWEQIEN